MEMNAVHEKSPPVKSVFCLDNSSLLGHFYNTNQIQRANAGSVYVFKTFVPSGKTGNRIVESSEANLTSLTADIVAAYVANNALTGDKLPEIIGSVYGALHRASVQAIEPPKVELTPAVPVKKSVTQDYIICLEDGKKFKSLKRHLRTHYDLSPEAYREKWGLPRDYPMVAPAYAAARSNLAKSMGLGRKMGAAASRRPGPAASSAPASKAPKTSTKRARS